MLDSAVRPGPAFDVHVGACGTTRTVVVAGELDLSVADRFETAIRTAIAEAPETVVIDLSALQFADSSGVQAVLRAHRDAQVHGVHLVIVPAGERVHRVFRLCGLDTVLPFVPAP